MVAPSIPLVRERHSRSAEAARVEERARIERLDGRARILLALRLGRRARLLATWTRVPNGRA